MATLTVNTISDAGTRWDNKFVAVTAAGDKFPNDGLTFIEIRNSHASNAYTVTAVVQKSIVQKGGYGNTTKSNSISVTGTGGALSKVLAGTFPKAAYNDVTASVRLTYSGTAPATDLTVAVAKMASGGVGG